MSIMVPALPPVKAQESPRSSVALPRPLVDQVTALAPPDLRGNFNRLVTVALEEYAARRKARAFEDAVARMAADPAVRKECASIDRNFAGADADGLTND